MITEWRDVLDLGFDQSMGVFKIQEEWYIVSSREKILVKPGLVDALIGHKVLTIGSRPFANQKYLHGLRAACTEVRPTGRGMALRKRFLQTRLRRASLLSVETFRIINLQTNQ